MEFTKGELLNAAAVLLKSENKDAKKVGRELESMVNDPDCGGDYDIINREHYFATVLWSLDDIRVMLRSKGYADTRQNITKVGSQLDVGGMEDCSDGWEYISQAIEAAKNDLAEPNMNNEEAARAFCKAIEEISKKPENLKNLESYLRSYFDVWLKKYSYDPASLAAEMKSFSEMEI